MKAVVIIVLLLLPCTALGAETIQSSSVPHTKHYEQSLFKMTEKGMFSVEMVIKEKELKVEVNTLAPANVDASTVRASAKKLFKVSYASESEPIPIGRISQLEIKS